MLLKKEKKNVPCGQMPLFRIVHRYSEDIALDALIRMKTSQIIQKKGQHNTLLMLTVIMLSLWQNPEQ